MHLAQPAVLVERCVAEVLGLDAEVGGDVVAGECGKFQRASIGRAE